MEGLTADPADHLKPCTAQEVCPSQIMGFLRKGFMLKLLVSGGKSRLFQTLKSL